MKIKKAAIITLSLVGTLAIAAAVGLPRLTLGQSPEEVNGNPTCADRRLGTHSFKLEPVQEGTYSLDGVNEVEVTLQENSTFDWNSDIGIDAVIVKGGPKANVYEYDPEKDSDEGLHAPENEKSEEDYYSLSHISFCFDYELEVEKTAETSFTRIYDWAIEKSVTPDSWEFFTGDTGESEYTVEVNKSEPIDSWAVSGDIKISNPAPMSAEITEIIDNIGGQVVTVDCGVSFPYELGSGETLECTYSKDLDSGASRTNEVTVQTRGEVLGNSATAEVIFGEPTTVENDQVTVKDTNLDETWSFQDSGTKTYTSTFSCQDQGTNDNTATIVETEQSASASVTVDCYDLEVQKTAHGFYGRQYYWNIDKRTTESEITVPIGQTYGIDYTVNVTATSQETSPLVRGEITVHNLAPITAAINGIKDVIDNNYADLDCGVITFPYSLPAGETLTCSYEIDLSNTCSGTNEAVVTLKNYSYDSQENSQEVGTTEYSAYADFSFGEPAQEIDKCVQVEDSLYGYLGQYCAEASEYTSHAFEYNGTVGPYEECGHYQVTNTATFTTSDTEATASDSQTVDIDVPCLPCGGCTLTYGYWRTHSSYGPASYDSTWAGIGENSLFFNSGESYYDVLWTPSDEGAYYQLAHQYIAVKLNILKGTYAPPEVQKAMSEAKGLFESCECNKFTGPNRKTAIELSETLDLYNNGYLGPEHCSY